MGKKADKAIKSLQGAAHLELEYKLCGSLAFSSEVGVLPFGRWGMTHRPTRIAGMFVAVAVVCSLVANLRMQDAHVRAALRCQCIQRVPPPICSATLTVVCYLAKPDRLHYPHPFYRCWSGKIMSVNVSCPWKTVLFLVLHVFSCVFGQTCVCPTPTLPTFEYNSIRISFLLSRANGRKSGRHLPQLEHVPTCPSDRAGVQTDCLLIGLVPSPLPLPSPVQ